MSRNVQQKSPETDGNSASASDSENKIMVANINARMIELGLSQAALARQATIGKTTLHNILSGRNGAHPNNLRKIAAALQTSPEALLTPPPASLNKVNESVQEYRILGAYTDMLSEGVQLPFIPYSAYGSFVSGCQDRHRSTDEFEQRWVKKIPGKNYEKAYLLEIRGNSMAPRYPDGSRYVVRSVSDGNWQYAQGVHAISLRGDGDGDAKFIIKRVRSNKNGVMLLTSDNNDQEMTIKLGDILCMWKVGEADYLPEED